MTVPVHETRPEVAVPCGCVVGEGPVWDGRTGTLHWVDIEGEALWSWRPDGGGEATSRPLGERAGFVLLTPDPDVVVLGRQSGVATFDLRTGRGDVVIRPEPSAPANRLNDGTVGPDGSLYFGSLNQAEEGREPTGFFYRWSPDGLSRFGAGTTTTNGPAIDPERRLLYATDTSRGRIDRHALAADGSVGPAEPFVTFRPGDGHPDGMAVDAEGHLWVCHFRGGRVTRFDPDGRPVLLVPMPTGQVTKLAFAGPDLSTAFVTTAARGLDREVDPLAGHLFRFEAGVRGLPSSYARMPGA